VSLQSNHGGICIFIRSRIKTKLINFPLYRTFELLPLFIHGYSINSLLLVIYRPGTITPTAEFVDEFADVLDRSSSYAKCIIVGDINVHLDDLTAPQAASFLSILDDFGLAERIQRPTHRHGHQLDVFITRSDQPVSDVQVDPPLLISDHSFVIAKFIVPFQPASARRPRVQRRCWKRFDVDAFTTDLLASDLVVSPPADVTEMFDCYNNTLRQLVNQHVPVITVTNYSRSTAPWFDRDCHLTKAKTRRFEKIYRRKGTCASEWDWREQYQKQRHLYSSKFASYWSNKIDSCGDNNKSI